MIDIEGIEFGFEPTAPILTGWTERFEKGRVVGLTGPSGRGKSTALFLLGLMLRPRAGRILLDGVDVTRLPERSRARLRASRYGFIFQDAVLDASRSVLDNVLETALYRGVPRSQELRRAHALLERMGVSARSRAKPGQISGGQAQRIALCRALLFRPDVVLADEPTGNLDIQSSLVVIDELRRCAAEGAVVVIATHDQRVVDSCDRVVRL